MTDFNGWPTLVLENQFLRLETLAASARIVRFQAFGGPNLFADLGNEPVSTPYGDFYFRGGHRLWHSPEAMPRTYIPDNEGGQVTRLPNGLRIDMPAEPWTNIAKSLEIHLNAERPQANFCPDARRVMKLILDGGYGTDPFVQQILAENENICQC